MAVRVAVFTSIPNIATTLLEHAPTLLLDVIDDPGLGGYGGTVIFDPAVLRNETRKQLAVCTVLIAEPAVLAALLAYDQHSLPNLKWCQSTYAGVDPMFKTLGLSMPLPFSMTRFAGKFGPPIAEWTMAQIISHERNFSAMRADQANNSWAGTRTVASYRYLSTLTLSILGCGDIGLCIARAAKAFGMKTIGFTKSSRENNCIPEVDEFVTDLPAALQRADYIVNVLPSTTYTRGLLNGEALAVAATTNGGNCPVFLNVGRGDVINETSLSRGLDCGYISAAILDVFETEPLPKESPLWSRPDVVISPHVSGITQSKDVPELFMENYERYCDNKELFYSVDWSKGY
jgi:phosphoglycerate dehydrogenase-like enzyme